jgi:hypothetical protein
MKSISSPPTVVLAGTCVTGTRTVEPTVFGLTVVAGTSTVVAVVVLDGTSTVVVGCVDETTVVVPDGSSVEATVGEAVLLVEDVLVFP